MNVMLISGLTIFGFWGISGVLSRKHLASFFAEHESRIKEGEKRTAVLAGLREEKHSLFRELASIRVLTATAAVGALSLTLVLVWRRKVSRPIALMSDRMHKMRLGTWSDPIPVEQHDEVGALVREFNDLGPQLSFTAHQYAAASKLAAMALIGHRVVRRTMSARQRLLAISEVLGRVPGDERFQGLAVEQLMLVARELETVAADFDSEFQAELARVGSSGALPTGGHRAA
jgi:HAMP domain-containing protein